MLVGFTGFLWFSAFCGVGIIQFRGFPVSLVGGWIWFGVGWLSCVFLVGLGFLAIWFGVSVCECVALRW